MSHDVQVCEGSFFERLLTRFSVPEDGEKPSLGFWVWGLGFGVWVWGLGFRV